MDLTFLLYVLVGFLAQMIDGALGMAYGVSSNSFLLSLGIPPAAASASVHMAEVVTTGISGYSHWKLGNVDWKLVRRLLVPGVIGGVLGAYILTSIDGNIIKPYIAIYLLIMGGVIIYKAFTIKPRKKPDEYHGPRISLLGLFGGFCDAIGGGGWGPVVTSTLVARGKNPRMTIGSVNFSEFFVTLGQSILFVLTLSFGEYWRVILGLLIGGAIAAPIAAKLAQKLPLKALMIFVGILIIALSIRTLYLAIK
ncbi:MAG: sulfite exporter TauE/SafE family protein [Anaerolineales bacterium]|nr:sulfite exporter TauE/SafE family protein [Anaerolineales bacterium]MBK8823235.1 sulfite exporter TauE/SafE family protein [Anaerolineales bacterium]